MMKRVWTNCSSFPAGIEAYLASLGLDAELHPGLAFYCGSLRPLMEPFSKNVFSLLHYSRSGPRKAVGEILAIGPGFYPDLPIGKGDSFKIWAMDENLPASPAAWGLRALEEGLKRRFKVEFDPIKPEHHFYMIKRKEGFTVFLYRENIDKLYIPEKGQLAPEIAYAMCRIARLRQDDIVLDPFSGRDSIPLVAARHFRCRRIFANDIETEAPNCYSGYERSGRDFLSPEFRLNPQASKIVTDPPWGMFSRLPDKGKFYSETLVAMDGNLAPGGTVVMLIPNDGILSLVEEAKSFRLEEKYNLLVNGKKALIVRLVKGE